MPAPPPADTMPTARPRSAVNHFVAVAESGVRNAPAAVGQYAPEEGARPHRHPVDERRHRDRAATPAHRVLERLEEHAEREEGSLPDRHDRGRGGEDDPAVEESTLTHGRELR